jgi:hypothetical protein
MSIIFGRVHWAITKKIKKKIKNKKIIIINISNLLIFNKLLTSSEHRNRNKPFYIYNKNLMNICQHIYVYMHRL